MVSTHTIATVGIGFLTRSKCGWSYLHLFPCENPWLSKAHWARNEGQMQGTVFLWTNLGETRELQWQSFCWVTRSSIIIHNHPLSSTIIYYHLLSSIIIYDFQVIFELEKCKEPPCWTSMLSVNSSGRNTKVEPPVFQRRVQGLHPDRSIRIHRFHHLWGVKDAGFIHSAWDLPSWRSKDITSNPWNVLSVNPWACFQDVLHL